MEKRNTSFFVKEASEYIKCRQYQIINYINSSEFPEWTWTDKLDSFNENEVIPVM